MYYLDSSINLFLTKRSTHMHKEEMADASIFEGFMKRRTVAISGEINNESIGTVVRRFINLQMESSDPINLLIDSGGGSTYEALHLCDLMKSIMTAPVRGIALGRCGSAATFILLYCKERISTPHSRFLIHSGMYNKISIPVNQTTTENLEQLLRDVKATEEIVIKLYMNRLTPKTWTDQTTDTERRAFVQSLIARGDQRFDDWMTAEEAVAVGLIERVVEEKLNIFTN